MVRNFENISMPFNDDGWGPPDSFVVSSSDTLTTIATANLFPDSPFAPFSRSEKLGCVADWTQNLSISDPYDDEGFGITSSNHEDNLAFRLVDSKSPPRSKSGPKKRDLRRKQLPQRQEEAKKREEDQDRNKIHHQRHESSVYIPLEWKMLQQISFSSLSDLSFSVQEPEDVHICGSLEYYNLFYDQIKPKDEKRLECFKNKNFLKVNTSDDSVIRRLAKEEEKATVFATDAVLAALMCAPRSVYSWNIVILRVGNKLFFDLLSEAEDDINSAYINQSFSQQVLVRDGKKETLSKESGENASSGAYRYRKWKLDDDMNLVARCELQSVVVDSNNKRSFLTLNAVNEYDSKDSSVDWRKKLESQKGAVLATVLSNNENKLEKWTAQALLANADMMKIGFVSRVNPWDHLNHVILSVLEYNPKDFARQLNLNTLNMWGIVKSIADVCMELSEGKYVLAKDPLKPQVTIYEVPLEVKAAQA